MPIKKLNPMPTVTAGCGLKPDHENTEEFEAIDFSKAAELLKHLHGDNERQSNNQNTETSEQ